MSFTMSLKIFTKVAFLYAMLLAFYFAVGKGNVIYITSDSVKVPCPEHSCVTLSQYAAEGLSSSTGNHSQSMELLLLPGDHYLDFTVTVRNISEFTLRSSSNVEVSQIICQVNKTRFQFENITNVHINRLKFVSCGNNIAEFVGNLTIQHTIFVGQNRSGTAMVVYDTDVNIVNTTFDSNTVGTLEYDNVSDSSIYVGGAVYAIHSKLEVKDSLFVRNHARNFGGAICTQLQSNITLINTNFTDNSVCLDSSPCYGGAIGHFSKTTQLIIIRSALFSLNRAVIGAAVASRNSVVNVQFSYFDRNYSPLNKSYIGAILYMDEETHSTINGSIFHNNSGDTVIDGGKSIFLIDSLLQYNKGYLRSVLRISKTVGASLIIRGSNFSNNAAFQGGVLHADRCNVSIYECRFDSNKVIASLYGLSYVEPEGGVMVSGNSYVTISRTNFTNNMAENGYGGVLALHTNVTLIIDDCTFLNNRAYHGGVIYVVHSILRFRGTNYIMRNHATFGGALFTDNTVVNVNGKLMISNNTAINSGGGTYLSQSMLNCDHSCTLRYEYNMAYHGGGLNALKSSISVLVERASIIKPSILFYENNAFLGGGMFLSASTLQVIKSGYQYVESNHSLFFTANIADYGAALFVNDESYFDTCLYQRECFLQVLSVNKRSSNNISDIKAMKFFRNNANKAGSVLFGGLLDRCKVFPPNELVVANSGFQVDGLKFFMNVSVTKENKGILISSTPMRVCLCSLDGKPDCSSIPVIEVKRGENFSLPVVAVDEVNQSMPYFSANTTIIIYARLNHTESGFGFGQLAQVTTKICTNLHFNIYSPYSLEEFNLYADGPCRNAGKSVLKVKVVFKECTCPVGFHPKKLEIENNCVCDCDPQLMPNYISSCDPQPQTVTRYGNSWISYLNITNDSNRYSYLTCSYCPLDYCLPPDTNVEINLNVQDGSDVQCRNNRSGLLCGVCRPGLSVSLGTSRCISCDGGHDLWWLILIFITAGVALVAMFLVLNMTVAVGTINGLVFYANIIGAASSTFFPNFSTKPAVFVAWLNLELGFDACFVDGLDTYIKTWIQMAFPTYIIFLLIVMIVWSERSLRFARLIGRRNPVALLATLIFLSYAKFLSMIITALLFITLEYPDGSHKVVWLPDASVDYHSAKHLILVVVAILILLVGSIYTILLLFWQWIRKWAAGKISHKVCHFFDIYQAPYKLKHRYWPGLLLLVRVILYLLFALINQSGDPRVNLIGIIIAICSLMLFKGACGRVYKNKVIDFLEVTSYVNITAFSAAQLYTLQSSKPQTISAFLSVSITAALLVTVVSYHMYTAIVLKVWQKCKVKIVHNRPDPVSQNRPRENEMRPYYFHDSIETNFVSTSVVEFPGTESLSTGHCNEDAKQYEAVNTNSEEESYDSADESCDNADSKPLLTHSNHN